MVKQKIGLVLVVVLLIANSILLYLSWSRQSNPQHPRGPGSTRLFLTEQLSLTKEQQQKYNDLVQEHRHRINEINQQVREQKDHFFDGLATVTDSSVVDQQAANISRLEAEKDKVTFYHFQALRKILTPQQQEKFDHIIQQALRQMPPPHEGGPPPHEGPHHDPDK
jgi:periplasmic protein CpxP/Spy